MYGKLQLSAKLHSNWYLILQILDLPPEWENDVLVSDQPGGVHSQPGGILNFRSRSQWKNCFTSWILIEIYHLCMIAGKGRGNLCWNKHVIGASLSELNTSMTALYKCVCSLACGHLNIFLLGTFSISQSLNLHVYTWVQLNATVKSLCQSPVSTWKRPGLKTSQAAHSCKNYIYREVKFPLQAWLNCCLIISLCTKSAMYCPLRLNPQWWTVSLVKTWICKLSNPLYSEHVFAATVLSRASVHGRSQLKCQKLRVGSYTEVVLEWFNYPHARAQPRCEVNCQGVPHHRFVLHWGQPDSGESCIMLQSWPTRTIASFASFCSNQLSLAVHKFRVAGKEHCERGHGRVCANVWCLMSWHPKHNRSYVSSVDLPSDSIRRNLAWWAVTRRTS